LLGEGVEVGKDGGHRIGMAVQARGRIDPGCPVVAIRANDLEGRTQ
jgi:hypothetical protein